jgi:diacylglycerol kinase (ATP)
MRPLVIVNPHAAGARAGRRTARLGPDVRAALGPFDLVKTEHRGHAEELARAAAAAGRELVVSVGGDGTLNEVVNGVLDAGGGRAEDVAVGFIPQGTGGDFRRSMGFADTDACLRALASGATRRLDVGLLEYAEADGSRQRRYFANIVSAGMGGLVDRYVVEAPPVVGGTLAYYIAAIRALGAAPLARVRCRVTVGEDVEWREIDSRVIAVCNGSYFGSGMHMAPGASMDDGRLEVVSVGTRTRAETVMKSPSIYVGRHLAFKAVQSFHCTAIQVTVDAPPERFPLDVDGDAIGYPPFSVRVVPGALLLRA